MLQELSKLRIPFGDKIIQLHHFFEQSVDLYPNHIALVCDNLILSYQELESRTNQLAHYLRAQQIGKGSIVGILLERSVESYIAILATLKAGAAYVPIEAEYPEERINYIFADLPFAAVLTSSTQLAQKKLNWPNTLVLDQSMESILGQPTERLSRLVEERPDDLCYVIYTSGSTGKPKGVEIPQQSICHYVRVASELYEIMPSDRVYQGFSLAFDASLEELWMAFANGATLVACTAKEVRSGLGLASFLQQHQVSVFSTVPTLLANLEGELTHLRLLILGGETCSERLVNTWSRAGLRIINTYGPTEATVIATYSECHADQQVTIGQALPGYELLIVDENLNEVPRGQVGELCIGGAALARGYVNRPDSTAEKFILNPANKNQRLYRTGDLVSCTERGQLHFVGRIDDQIKLRGFRIELNEIEQVMMHYPGVKQSVVSLQTLDKPSLVAYLILEQNNSFNLNEFRSHLKAKLPDYMMPAAIELRDAFPVLTSGKVNRKELPKPQLIHFDKEFKAPQSELALQISEVWQKAFDCGPISMDADFFYDLGGHSLLAAKVISNLRKISALKNISILDLYKNPSIGQLEEQFIRQINATDTEAAQKKKKYQAPQWKYYLCGIGQVFGCLLQYSIGTLQLLAIVLCYSWVSPVDSILASESHLAVLGLFFVLPLISLSLTVSLKWILLGRIKAGEYPLWGWFYYRWWLVQRLQKNLFIGKFITGTPLATLYYRLFGAKVGKNCHLGSMQAAAHDLLSIGDNTSIGTDSRLYGYVVEDGWLKIGAIDIGSNVYIGARAVIGMNSLIEDGAVLDDMSMLADNGSILAGAYCSGSPATHQPLPAGHFARQKIKRIAPSMLKTTGFGLLHYLGVVFVMLIYNLCLLPGIALATHYYDQSRYLMTMFFAIPVAATLFMCLYFTATFLCKKIILNKIKPGQYSLYSVYYFRHWLLMKMIDCDEVSILADTLYMPAFLRLLGARLGKGVEMGEAPHIIPDLVTIEEGGFTASSVALAWPQVFNGLINFAAVRIGRRGFVGNVSLLPAGKTIGDGTLLGCLSVPPTNDRAKEANSAWLGSPAVYLPKREMFAGFTEQQTYFPSKKLYATRLVIEFFRIILPTTFALVVLFNLLYVVDYLLTHSSILATALVLPVAELFFTLCMIGVLVGLKWTLLGKLKPLTKPIWDPFIWKNDVIEYSYNYFINPSFTNKVLGTPFALWIHRCLGSKIGKRVFTDSAEFSEFDLISIGDDVCINAETILQTHLYEDRIFKVAQVNISSGCNIGVGSIILYNTFMEENSSLGSLSLLMKGECLPANTTWAGIPAQSTAFNLGYLQLQQVSMPTLATAAMSEV